MLQVGLKVLQKDHQVFACHKTIADTIWHSELGASLAIIKVRYVLAKVYLASYLLCIQGCQC